MSAGTRLARAVMSYKVYLFDALTPIGWSQATWRIEGPGVPTDDCPHKRVHDVLLRHLPRPGRIVDAGCGSAKWPIYLRRLGYDVVGVDVSLEACGVARRVDGSLALVAADVRRLPLQSDSIDGMLSLGVVEHDEAGPLDILREAHRVLRKPRGVLVLSVPYDNLLRRVVVNPLLDRVNRRRRRAGSRLVFEEYRFTEREVRRFLEQAGFEVLSSHPDDYDPPRTEGMWADYQNLTFNPWVTPSAEELFVLPGWKGRLAGALLRVAPWVACGEVAVVARPR